MRLLAGTAGAATAVSLSDSSSGLDHVPPHGDMSELEECVRVLHAKLDELQQKRNSGAPLEEDLTAFSVELDRLLDEKSKFDSKSQELRNGRSTTAVRSISRQSSLAPSVQRIGQISPVKMRPAPAQLSTRMSRSPTNGSSMSLSGSVQIPVPNSVRVSSPTRLRSARPAPVTGSSVRLLPNTPLASGPLAATAPLPSGPLAAASLPGTPLTGTPISSLSLPPGNALVAAPVPPMAQVLPTQIPSLPPFLAASPSQQFLVSTPLLVPMGPQQLFLSPPPAVARGRGSPKSERPHSARRSRHREADPCCAGWG